MAKGAVGKSSQSGGRSASNQSGTWEKSNASGGEGTSVRAASAMPMKPTAASALTQRVVKESSKTHSDALKRLVDR